MFKNKLSIVGAVIIGVFVLVTIFAPYMAPYDPCKLNLEEGLNGPNSKHLLGQDKLGRDILSRIIYGCSISMWVSFYTVGISALIGLILGSLAGYFGGIVDEVIMRVIDILLAFPGILLAIAIMAILGPSLGNIIIALCIMGWVGYARLVRGQILSIREHEFILAAKAAGINSFQIISRHILPNIVTPLMIQVTFGIASVITAEAGLSFLGLGVQPPTPSWGSMLNEGRSYILIASHLTIFPGLAIMLVVLGFNFLGDGLRDYLDPKSLK